MRILAFSTALLALAASWPASDAQGVWRGFDVDVCRAVAAAVLGDGMQVRIAPLSPPQRFTALQSGEVDILSRQTTWTLQRDAGQGMNFTVVVYYDGQGFLVPRRLNVAHARELDGATVCVTAGTTSELNAAEYGRRNNANFRFVVFERNEETRAAYLAGRVAHADGGGETGCVLSQ